MNGKVVSKMSGTYLGYIEFDKVRYWDIRDFKPYQVIPCARTLPSDSRYRSDLQTLASGDIPNAQKRKEGLEQAQRKDARLRAEALKPLKKKRRWF